MTDSTHATAACSRADFHAAMSMTCQECGYQPGPTTAATACPHCGATRWTWFGKRVLKCSICGQFCYPEGDSDDE